MTRLEKQIGNVCYRDDCGVDLEYDPKEGHWHVDPPAPDFMGEWVTYSDDPVKMHPNMDDEWGVKELRELRDWLNVMLEEVE